MPDFRYSDHGEELLAQGRTEFERAADAVDPVTAEAARPEPVTASGILDRIARAHPRCALIREVVVDDEIAWSQYRAALAALTPTELKAGASIHVPLPMTRRRVDGLLLKGSATRTAIEVKISHRDFRRESTSKRGVWQRITHRFVYAAPPGVIDPDEIPDGCGLWLVDADAITIAKRATINPEPDPLPYQVTVALAYRLRKMSRVRKERDPHA